MIIIKLMLSVMVLGSGLCCGSVPQREVTHISLNNSDGPVITTFFRPVMRKMPSVQEVSRVTHQAAQQIHVQLGRGALQSLIEKQQILKCEKEARLGLLQRISQAFPDNNKYKLDLIDVKNELRRCNALIGVFEAMLKDLVK